MLEIKIKQLLQNRESIPVTEYGEKDIHVNNVSDLIEAIESAKVGIKICIAKGVYKIPRDINLSGNNITIKGMGDAPSDVILDGEDGQLDSGIDLPKSIIRIRNSNKISFYNLSFKNSPKYGIMFYSFSGIKNLKIHSVVFHNIWARGLKGTNPRNHFDELGQRDFDWELMEDRCAKNGEVRNCLFIADRIKDDLEDGFNGDYIAGTDMMGIRNWVISDNTFVGIRGANQGARGGIFIWQHAEKVIIERNIILDCDKGIAIGNPSSHNRSPYNVLKAKVNDNVILANNNKALEIDDCSAAKITNNIISNQTNEYPALLCLASKSVLFENNIIHGEIKIEGTNYWKENTEKSMNEKYDKNLLNLLKDYPDYK